MKDLPSITPTVSAIGRLGITGNVTPKIWFSRIQKSNKPDYKAIILLSEIIYWYRPTEIRDETSGELRGYRKKFKEDMLRRSYQAFADEFGMSKREAQDALKRLRDAGLVRLELRQNNFNGVPQSNVLYVEPIAEKIDQITFGEPDAAFDIDAYDDKESSELPTNVIGVTSTRNTPYVEMEHPLRTDVIPPTPNRVTYTEITTEITSEINLNTCSPSTNDRMTNQNYLKSRFNEFYETYQKKVNRQSAEKAFLKITLPAQHRDYFVSSIIDKARQWAELFVNAPDDQKVYQPHPASWINGKRWDDESLPVVRQALPVGVVPNYSSSPRASQREQVNDSLTNIQDTNW